MCLIQINNLKRVFLKFRLLLWSLFNLQMYTHMYKFKLFPILSYLEQLSAVVFGKQEFRDMYIGSLVKVLCACVYVCVQFFL